MEQRPVKRGVRRMGGDDKTDKTAVSVIMGTRYTKADLAPLQRAVGSILAQSFADIEFLICDDGSTDDARAYLESLPDKRVRLVRKDGCLDLASKLNLCLAHSKGRYIARMDDDDWSRPDRLEKEAAFLAAHQDIAFVGCNAALIRNGQKIGERRLPERPEVRDFYMTQPYIHPTLVFRSEALKAVGGYSESKSCVLCEDYDLLLRLYKQGYVGANLQQLLFDYTLPATARGNRTMAHRWNETVTRWKRFRELDQFPAALPFVLKPLAVGLLPEPVLQRIKSAKG